MPPNKLTERIFGTKREEVKGERPKYLLKTFISFI
jgi:hypothetical protein